MRIRPRVSSLPVVNILGNWRHHVSDERFSSTNANRQLGRNFIICRRIADRFGALLVVSNGVLAEGGEAGAGVTGRS